VLWVKAGEVIPEIQTSLDKVVLQILLEAL
jgi:hypothetical protein